MRKKYKISLCALLLVGAASMMTAGAQGSGKPTLAVFVVGMDNTLGNALATQIGSNLTSGGQYTLTSVNTTGKRDELRATYASGGGSSINRSALAAWGRANGISAICLVVDDVKGSDHMFYAQLIDAKDSKVLSRGNYVRTGVGSGELPRVSSALAQQLNGPERRRSTPTPTRAYPAELDIEMVFVKGGTFEMGCKAGRDDKTFPCGADNVPPHWVKVNDFHIGKYEVTQAQWQAMMGSLPSKMTGDVLGDEKPVGGMTYYEIVEFMERLNALTGKSYRLPTEAEWEYAARGCEAGDCESFEYIGSDNCDDVAWYGVNSSSSISARPVGGKLPNGLGIYDMAGNVWERCSDWYSTSYYPSGTTASSPQDNPTGPDPGGPDQVIRGSAWLNDASVCCPPFRYMFRPIFSDISVGFRLVLP